MAYDNMIDEPWRKQAPEVHELSGLALPPLQRLQLPNGITLNVLDRGDADVCRLGIFMRGGSAENRTQSIAALASSLIREGSKDYPGSALADLFERNGAWLDTSAHTHHTSVHIYSLNNRFCRILPGVADMVLNPELSDDVFNIFRENKARALETELCKVATVAMRESDRIFLGQGHPMARLERPDDIRNLTAGDIRDFHGSRCDASNISLFLTGKINDKTINAVADIFGSIKAENEPYQLDVRLPQGIWSQDVHHVGLPGAAQAAVRMTIPAVSREHDDYEMLRIAVCALGGYFGSRLNANIREAKGLTYGIAASIIGIDGYGAINISCQCDNRYTDTVISEIHHELHRMESGDYTADEIARLKRFYMTSLSAILESPFSVTDFYESSYIAKIPADYFAQQLNALDALSAESLSEMASKYFKSDAALTVVAGQKTQA